MNTVFADSFYFVALLSEDDSAHEQADAASRDLEGLHSRAGRRRILTRKWMRGGAEPCAFEEE